MVSIEGDRITHRGDQRIGVFFRVADHDGCSGTGVLTIQYSPCNISALVDAMWYKVGEDIFKDSARRISGAGGRAALEALW